MALLQFVFASRVIHFGPDADRLTKTAIRLKKLHVDQLACPVKKMATRKIGKLLPPFFRILLHSDMAL
jgi:hypothetical protein